MAFSRQAPASTPASARIQPVLRRSPPSRPSRKALAEAATLGAANSGRIRCLACPRVVDQSSSVVPHEVEDHPPPQPKPLKKEPPPPTVKLRQPLPTSAGLAG